MKKIISILAFFVFVCALVGCGGVPSSSETTSSPAATQQEEPSATQQQVQSSSNPIESGETEEPLESTSEPQTEQEPEMENNILVAYFSATNTTEQIAQQAADMLGADIYEIIPEDPYTEADLAYYTGGRADQEQDDPSARPSISGSVENMDQYDTILLGYPIWHGQAPRIISTFLESYDFDGKTIIPFCTSHSSGVGSSASNLHSFCSDTVTWADGTRFASGASSEEIKNWLSSVLPDAIY